MNLKNMKATGFRMLKLSGFLSLMVRWYSLMRYLLD